MMAKRLLDLAVVILSMPITLPVILIAGVFLRVFQGKNIFFTQERIGKDGIPFKLIKFRTMKAGEGSDIERTTFIGNLLRKTSIDELPEILNILKGEMSCVGPRPLPTYYEGFFSKEEYARHKVVPGLTGLAQIYGRNLFSWKEKFQNDLKYIETQNIWLDLKIIAKTFLAIFNFKKVNATINRTMSALNDRVCIVGAGGHAKVVLETALAAGHEIAGVYDDNSKLHGKQFYTYTIRALSEIPNNALVILAIGNNHVREKLSNANWRFATLIHPSANISPTAVIGKGAVVFMGASVQAEASLGEHTIVNTNSSVDHDCVISDFVHIAPGVSLCGDVQIGERSLIGIGSNIIPQIRVCSDVVVGGGSTITKDIKKPGLWAGLPVKLKKEYNMEDVKSKRPIAMANPDLTEKEVEAVAEVVRSNRLALGPNIKKFEEQFSDYTGRKHAIAVSSGTAGLHLSLMALDIKKGDEVMVPSYTFVASVNCILYMGATPVFVDVDENTYCVCPKDVKRKISDKTKALICVDVFGHPAALDELEILCKEEGIHLIDDSCEGLGAEVAGKRVGAWGDVATFAFYPNKQITTGEGGMVVTDNDEIARKIRTYMNQGRDSMSQWLEHVELGWNFRMSEIQAALGVVQMERVEEILSKREKVAKWYLEELANSPEIKTQYIAKNAKMSWFVFVVTLPEGMDRDEVIKQLDAKGIPARAYFTPIHTQPYLAKYKIKGTEHLPVTLKIGKLTMALPFYGNMPKEDVKEVAQTLKEVVATHTINTQKAA